MAPNINNPGGVKNDPDEIRDAVVSDATRFPGGFIDQQLTETGAPLTFRGRFRLSNADFTTAFDTSPQVTDPTGVGFSSSGGRMYVVDGNSENIDQYDLSIAFDISTASFDDEFSVFSQVGAPHSIDFNTDGSQMYVSDLDADSIFQYNLSTAFDVTTGSFDVSVDVSTNCNNPRGMAFSDDGSQLFVSSTISDIIGEYNLSTSFDVSTATFDSSLDVSPQDGGPTGVTFNNGGNRMFVSGRGNNNVYQYILSTGFDVSTATFDRSFDVSPQDGDATGLDFNIDGSRMYVTGRNGNNVYQYAVGKVVGELP